VSRDSSAFAERWIAQSLDHAPLTDLDRDQIVGGIRRCYQAADLPWHDNVCWVSSPQQLRSAIKSSRASIQEFDRRRPSRSRQAQLADLVQNLLRVGERTLIVVAASATFGGLILCMVLLAGWARNDGNFLAICLLLACGYASLLDLILTIGVLAESVESVILWKNRRFTPVTLAITQAFHRSLDADDLDENPLPIQAAMRETLTPLWTSLWSPIEPSKTPFFARDLPIGLGRAQTGEHSLAGAAWRAENDPLAYGRNALEGMLATRRAFAWIPYGSLTIICEPPQQLHLQRVAGVGRLHHDGGPAVIWPDAEEYFLSGVRVPKNLYRPDFSIKELHAEPDDDVRRVAIERIGWPDYVRRAKLPLIAVSPDPGNVQHELQLYALPVGIHSTSRLLMMTNGSPDSSGRQIQYAELVPGEYDDPIEAAAWQYDCPVHVYRQLARRT
jgi:hypothetical protein